MIELPSAVTTAISALEQAGFEAYLVGGCVRDSLMGNTPKDYDLTTSALPQEMKRVFSVFSVIETGLKHGTLTVLIDGMPLEITTYRVDAEYSDSRHPDSVHFTKSLREDTARRDFTINAMAYNPHTGLTDYFAGQDDLRNGIIRCVGTADLRFEEDALRILRALRFASVLDFSIEGSTRQAIFTYKPLLKAISAERISAELTGLLCGRAAHRILMEYLDIIGFVLPELLPMHGFAQHNPYHIYDVWEHTAHVVENIRPLPTLRWAALLHDVGKPACFTMDADGIGHFYGHADTGAVLCKQILSRLKFSNENRQQITFLVKYHGVQITPTPSGVRRALNKYSSELFFPLLELMKADTLAQNPACHDRLTEYAQLKLLAQKVLSEKQCFGLHALAINGNDLIELGMKSGPKMGALLNQLLQEVINEKITNDKAALTARARVLLSDTEKQE